MQSKKVLVGAIAAAVILPAALIASLAIAKEQGNVPERPEGPCDIYAEGGTPCVAAHSSTRALYASYDGPLYQVMRQSDGKTLDIGVVKPSAGDPGGYADAAAQDEFCKDTYCWITILYDQSGKGNHLYQAPRGGFSGPAMGGYNNVPVADWAPVTIMGHKVYGVMIVPGMGLRQDDPVGTAVDDQAEGQYWVISGHHYNSGCCFDYGNAETDSRDDGDGTMETTYFGNQPAWYHGQAPGPWIMTDQENNLVGCVNPDPNDRYCDELETVNWRFITATADGEPHHWRSMGGNAQEGALKVYYDGQRIQNPRSSYDPMRKQGAILLGNGGDNSNGSSGTFYEAAMTAAGTFPTEEINQAIQANVVAARYDVQRLAITAADKTENPSFVQSFAPGSTRNTVVTFVNTTGETINDLEISVAAPKGWKVALLGKGESSKKVNYSVAPGQTVAVHFAVTSSTQSFNGDLVAKADWTSAGVDMNERAVEKVRNTPAVKVNEFSSSDSFIELYNASDEAVDISGWTVTHHTANIPYFSAIKVPAGTRLGAKSYYLMGMSNSGLAVDAAKGDNVIYVRSVEGIKVGDEIVVGTGKNAEKRVVKAVGAPEQPTPGNPQEPGFGRGYIPAGTPTTIWQPLPSGKGGHGIEIAPGAKNIPVTSNQWFKVGDKMAIGYGTTKGAAVSNSTEKYEVVTVTAVGKPGTQAYLTMDAKPGDRNIKVSSTANISVGDKIRLDIESEGHGIEVVTVKKVGTASVRDTRAGALKDGEDPGTGLELKEKIKYHHSSNMPLSVNGTGISFTPATKHSHFSNEPVLALAYSIELESALSSSHDINDVVYDAASKAGYQGEADQMFGGPELSSQGNITLRDASGNVADAVNFGLVTDPWLGEGWQSESGYEQPGNFAVAPSVRMRSPMMPGEQTAAPALSSGRYPDGNDTDDNKNDFHVQTSVSLAAPAKAGDTNIKVSSVEGLQIGKKVLLGGEEVQVATIGTAGATKLAAAASAGASKISVESAGNFTVGQEIFVAGQKAKVAKVNVIRRRWGPAPGQGNVEHDSIELESSLSKAVKAGDDVTGTGVALAYPVKSAHASGSSVTDNATTPGKPNRY